MKADVARSVLLSALAIALACGCGRNDPGESIQQDDSAIKLSMLFPAQSTYHRGADRWADLLRRESGGKLRLEIFSGGALLKGRGGDQLGLLKSGVADIALVRPAELAHISPSLQVFYLPFLFPNRRSADAVLNGVEGRKLLGGLSGGEMIGLGYFTGRFLQLSSNRRVVIPEDMDGLKVRLPGYRRGRVDS